MNQIKIGQLICALRKEKGYTRLEPANKLAVSDKAVSKWARGHGQLFWYYTDHGLFSQII